MTVSAWARLRAYRALFFVAAMAVAVVSGLPARAGEVQTIRLRPSANTFITPSGNAVRRILNVYMTLSQAGVRALCGNLASVRSVVLVKSFNRRLTGDQRHDMTALARGLYAGLAGLVGRDKLSAVHVAFGFQRDAGAKSNIQKQREEVRDCAQVRELPEGAVTVTYQDTMSPLPEPARESRGKKVSTLR